MRTHYSGNALGLFAAAAGLVCFATIPTAGAAPAATDSPGPNIFEDLAASDWSTLYSDKDGPINEVSLLGRFDLQYGYFDSDHGEVEKFEVRRFRLGGDVDFLDDWRIKVLADLVDGSHTRYAGINTALIRYKPSKEFKITFGKQVAPFTQEWSESSMDLGVIERSLLIEQIRPERSLGLTVEGDWNRFDYGLGVFSGSADQNLGGFDGGYFYLASLGYDFSKVFDWWKDFDLRLYYLHNDGDVGNNALEPYANSYSAAIKLRKKRFRLTGEALYAEGMTGRPDAWGFLVTPSWELVEDKLDLVLRYHFAEGDGQDGLRLRNRYEMEAPTLTDRGRGDEYQSLYLGLKYHLIEDQLVFLTGAEWMELRDNYGDGGDLEGFSLLSALRFNF